MVGVTTGRGTVYSLKFEVVIMFGKTELEAFIRWTDRRVRILILVLEFVFLMMIGWLANVGEVE